jgi:SAM-dependent methyltransferase
MAFEQYTSGEYLKKNPSWGTEDSKWKAAQILEMLDRHALPLRRVGEVGCGAGEILRQLHDKLDPAIEFVGYDVSPQAIDLAQSRATSRLRFQLKDIHDDDVGHFDLILLIDVIEHVQDYFDLLETARRRSTYTMLHIPLDLSALSVARPHSLVDTYNSLGHVHFFVKATTLRILDDVGFDILDWKYTTVFGMTHRPPGSPKLRALNAARKLIHSVSPDLSARLLGGYSLLVLAR